MTILPVSCGSGSHSLTEALRKRVLKTKESASREWKRTPGRTPVAHPFLFSWGPGTSALSAEPSFSEPHARPSAVSSHCGCLAGCSIFRLFIPIYFIQLQCPWLSFKSCHFLSLFRNPHLSFLSIFEQVATVSVLAFISDHAHQVAPSDKPRLPPLLTAFLWSLLWMFTEDTYFFMAYQLPPTYLKCSSSIKSSQMSLRGIRLNCPGDL